MIAEIESLTISFSHLPSQIIPPNARDSDKDAFIKMEGERFSSLQYWSSYWLAILNYRLLPFHRIEYLGSSSFKRFKGQRIPEDFSDFSDKHIAVGNKKILWDVLTEYEQVTIDDLKNEFWEFIPSPSKVSEYYSAIKMKYRDVFSHLPDKHFWNFELVNDVKFMRYFNALIANGIAEKKDVEALILKICNIVERLEYVHAQIVEAYSKLLPEEAHEQINSSDSIKMPDEDSIVLPPEIDTPLARKVFARAMKSGYMEATTNGYKWTYGMDHGRKTSLAYFLYKIFPYGTFPEKKLNSLFGVDRLSSYYDQLKKTKWFTSGYFEKPKWVKDIDALFVD